MSRSFGRRSITGVVTLLVPLVLSGAPATTRTPLPATRVGSGAALPAAGAGSGAAPGVAAVPLDQLTVAATRVATGLQLPTAMTAPDDGSGRLLITERSGRVRVYQPATGLAAAPLLDITDRVLAGGERGLLGIVTARDFTHTRALYVAYTARPNGTVTLSRFTLDRADQNPVPRDREQILLTQPHAEFPTHNGGQLAFGPDGYLYWSLGDGGGGNDPLNSAQDPGRLLGKILRIDVGCPNRPYCVPAGNPFVATPGARPEIWALGLRNPWKFSFDARDGSLWIGDVGEGSYEEINHLSPGVAGANLGWSCREGPRVASAARCRPGAQYVDPVFYYRTHVEGCAIIGGHVYRGRQYAGLADGVYLAADFCSGTAFAVREGPNRSYEGQPLGNLVGNPSTFGVDAAGELYVATFGSGQLHRISFGQRLPHA